MPSCARMNHQFRLFNEDGISIPLTLVTCSVCHIPLRKAIRTQGLIMKDGELELDGKAKTTRVVYSPNGSFTGSITEATPQGPVISQVQKPWDLIPQCLSRHQTDTLRRIQEKLSGVEGLDLVSVSLPVEVPPFLKPSPDASDEYPKSVQVHGVSRLTTRCKQVYRT